MNSMALKFLIDEDGAVTVDWVVLTAAIMALAIAVISSISGGLLDLASYIMQSLMDGEVATLDGLSSAADTLPPPSP